MQEHKTFRDYLDKVCEQIRWKKAHVIACRELGDHLEDRQAALLESGLTEDEAANQAVLDMGDAALVGSQLDHTYRPRPAWGIIAVTAALMIVGYFARLYIIQHADSFHVVDIPRSIFWLFAAVAVMAIGYFLDFSIIGKHPIIIGAVYVIIILFLVFIGGAYIYFANCLKVFFPTVFAGILWWWPYKGYSGLLSIYLVLALMTIAGLTIGNSISLFFFYVGLCGLMLTIEMLKGKFGIRKSLGMLILYSPVALVILLLIGNTSILNAIALRFTIMFNPHMEPLGAGFLGVQIREILANARWIGSGGYPAYYLPGVVDDFMLTFFIGRFGWISLVIVLLFLGALFAFAYILVKKQKSKLGRMVSLAILISLAANSLFYIANNISLGAFSTTSLLLLSFGNTPLLIDSFLIGLMLSVFRNNDIVRDTTVAPKMIPRIKISMERQ